VDEYERMIDAGILYDGERVELINGEIVHMAALGGPHLACVDRLNVIFVIAVAGRAQVRVQGSIRLPPRSEPEPDLVLLRPSDDFYASGHPGPLDIFLVIEVSHSSLQHDRRVKVPMYARAGIVEVWVVDVDARRVEVHREPEGDRFRDVRIYGSDAIIAPLAFPELAIRVAEIVG